MAGVAVVGEDDNVVPALLQPNRRIDDQPLSAADAQIRMEEDNCASRRAGRRRGVHLRRHFEVLVTLEMQLQGSLTGRSLKSFTTFVW
ncbi:hypothetical protein MKX07_008855 [Trichoderma sp. CBMAI-0711]|nr:hypothetical protein MKX07_008855 [Trichoderma sp. CBMAI-0711]